MFDNCDLLLQYGSLHRPRVIWHYFQIDVAGLQPPATSGVKAYIRLGEAAGIYSA